MSSTTKKMVPRAVALTVVLGLCLFPAAGTWAWWNAWVFLVFSVGVVGVLTGLVFSKSPGLLEERMTAAPKAKPWDRIIVPLLAGVLPLAAIVVAGLDRRFGWTSPAGWARPTLALAVMLAGTIVTFRAMRANRFFSSHVRIQHDRGHEVISSGPYAIVRHPGYVGTILFNLAAPVFLGSWPALWVGVATTALFVARTALEDRTLRAELPGYQDYSARVRYRLLPFVW